MPYNDDPLVFPAGAAGKTTVNDLGGPPIPLYRVGLVSFTGGGYNVSGGTLYLDAGISNTGSNTWGVYSIMNTAESFISNGGTLTISNTLDNGGYNLTVSGTGATVFAAAITDSGGLTKNGSGTAVLSGSNSYNGATTINAGTLTFANTAALYDGSSGSWVPANITVAAGATLGIRVGSAASGYFDAGASGDPPQRQPSGREHPNDGPEDRRYPGAGHDQRQQRHFYLQRFHYQCRQQRRHRS